MMSYSGVTAAVSVVESEAVSVALLALVSVLVLTAIQKAELEAESTVESVALRVTVSKALSAAVPAAVTPALLADILDLLEYWTDYLTFTRRRMTMNNSRGEQSISIPREGLNIVVRQLHVGHWVTEIRRPRHRLCTFDNAEEVALAFHRAVFNLMGETAGLNFPHVFLHQNRASESTAPPRTEFPPPAQQRNPEEDPGSGRSEAMAAAAADNEVEGLGWGSGTGEGERRKIVERENKKTCGVRITIPLKDILKYSEMILVDAAKNLNVSRTTLKRICREYDIKRWPPRRLLLFIQIGPNYPPRRNNHRTQIQT